MPEASLHVEAAAASRTQARSRACAFRPLRQLARTARHDADSSVLGMSQFRAHATMACRKSTSGTGASHPNASKVGDPSRCGCTALDFNPRRARRSSRGMGMKSAYVMTGHAGGQLRPSSQAVGVRPIDIVRRVVRGDSRPDCHFVRGRGVRRLLRRALIVRRAASMLMPLNVERGSP